MIDQRRRWCVRVLQPEPPSSNLWLSVSARRPDVEFRSSSVRRSPEAFIPPWWTDDETKHWRWKRSLSFFNRFFQRADPSNEVKPSEPVRPHCFTSNHRNNHRGSQTAVPGPPPVHELKLGALKKITASCWFQFLLLSIICGTKHK